jgi:uncharacterized DUF497 family protein
MRFEWDEDKRAANITKHGLDFADVPHLGWETATILPDERFAYGERRFWAFAKLNGRLHMVAFTRRKTAFRIISFRKASTREVRRYEKR